MKYIHPFPARMAPELALKSISRLRPNSVVLDPMMGSGTVLREALTHGHTAIGYDLDPLALLISKVTNTPFDLKEFSAYADNFILTVQTLKDDEIVLTWIDNSLETSNFIDFWYGKKQKDEIRKIAKAIQIESEQETMSPIFLDAIKIALSRIIITKEMKASLARDTAHSRPHRVALTNEYDVYKGFCASLKSIIKILHGYFKSCNIAANIYSGDARRMENLLSGSVDTIITSPPYLNAIDYLRGHKLSLIWFGFTLADIRSIRDSTVGLEKILAGDTGSASIYDAIERSTEYNNHSKNEQRTIFKYAVDLNAVLGEYRRVLREGGLATFVVANSNIKGKTVDNANIVKVLAESLGFAMREHIIRDIPSQGRYLPVSVNGTNPLANRMKQESVMTFVAH